MLKKLPGFSDGSTRASLIGCSESSKRDGFTNQDPTAAAHRHHGNLPPAILDSTTTTFANMRQ